MFLSVALLYHKRLFRQTNISHVYNIKVVC